jgi:hypothetical protein
MSYSQDGDRVTLELSRDDYDYLLVLLGMALPAIKTSLGREAFIAAIALLNRLNEGNPGFDPYQIPESIPDKRKETE